MKHLAAAAATRRRRTRTRILIPAIVGILFLSGCAAATSKPSGSESGGPNTVAEIAKYQGKDRQEILESGAKAEGKLSLYGTSILETTLQPLVDAFKEKYPYLAVNVFRGDGAAVSARFTQEYDAGQYLVDVVETNPIVLVDEKDMLTPYYSPELKSYPKKALDPEGYYAPMRNDAFGLAYNTIVVNESEVPKTYKDLLAPRWKGLIQIPSGSSGIYMIGELFENKKYGESFLKKLAANDLVPQSLSSQAILDQIASGAAPIGVQMVNNQVAAEAAKGAPVKWVPLEPATLSQGALALPAHAAHPHAAMLFMDFALSKQGQQVIWDSGREPSLRTDMSFPGDPYPLDGFDKVYLDLEIPDLATEYAKWQSLFSQLFIAK